MPLTNASSRLRPVRQLGSGGFSLVEILIVLGLILVIASIAVVSYGQIRSSANKRATEAMIGNTVEAVNLYQTTMNRYPDMEQGLDALVEEPEDLGLEEEGEAGAASGEWAGPYLKDGEIPRDPWGNELRYEPLEQTEGVEGNRPPFRVWSLGPDGQDGTEDDIANWSEES